MKSIENPTYKRNKDETKMNMFNNIGRQRYRYQHHSISPAHLKKGINDGAPSVAVSTGMAKRTLPRILRKTVKREASSKRDNTNHGQSIVARRQRKSYRAQGDSKTGVRQTTKVATCIARTSRRKQWRKMFPTTCLPQRRRKMVSAGGWCDAVPSGRHQLKMMKV